jgi:hypothetical protein
VGLAKAAVKAMDSRSGGRDGMKPFTAWELAELARLYKCLFGGNNASKIKN